MAKYGEDQHQSGLNDLSRFTYGFSHDLKAPLASIIGLLRFCSEDLEDGNYEEVRQNLTQALEMCYRGARRVDDLLDMARAGAQEVQLEIIDLGELISGTWQNLTTPTDTPASLTLTMSHRMPLRSDQHALRSIFENLLSNALCFCDPQKPELQVEVTAETIGNTLRVTVSDNGSGIPENRHEDVFQVFRAIDRRGGNGLGLAMTRRQIDRLNGVIYFQSIEGTGSDFIFEIPQKPRP
ncbi:MAG: HAMP domain-containing sensor histidine kinase [Pseudomonadota bacterium]